VKTLSSNVILAEYFLDVNRGKGKLNMIKSQMIQSKRKDKNKLSSDDEKYIIEKSKQNRNRIILLLTITIYGLLVVLGTTDEDIFLNNPIQMPLIKISLPLIYFYLAMPILIVMLHFNVIHMLERNRGDILKATNKLPMSIIDTIYDAKGLLGTIMAIIVYMLPLLVLSYFLYRFSDYQSFLYTASHLVIFITDVIILWKVKEKYAFSLGIVIAFFNILYVCTFYLFLDGKVEKVNEFFPPRLVVTNTNLNKNIDLSLLNAYAKEENVEHPLSLITPVSMRDRNFLYADFSYSKMYRFDFSGSNISYANFHHAKLPYSIFHKVSAYKSDFSEVYMSSSDIHDMNATKSNFGRVNLTQSNIYDSDFSNSMLEGIDFSGSIVHSDFTKAQLVRSRFLCSDIVGNFQEARLLAADFSGSNIVGVSFIRACLADAKFVGVVATGLDVRSAFFYNTDFTGVVDAWSKGSKIIQKYQSYSTGHVTPLQERLNFETNLTGLFNSIEGKKKYIFNDYNNRVSSSLCMGAYDSNSSKVLRKAMGKNSIEWINFNQGEIVTGKFTQEMIDNIIKKVKNNTKALENIYYDKNNKLKD